VQPADSKFFWYFGDGGNSELAAPTYIFKKAGTWVINLKIVDKNGKVCYGEAKGQFEGETNPPLTARGKVKKLDVAGCDLVIALDNGILVPAKIATNFLLKEGQYVEFTYEKYAEKVTNCKEGTDVKILTIKEIQTISVCKFDIVVKPKEATPKSFLFYTVSQAEIKTWKWKFGDGQGSELKNPEHAYEKTGTYEVSCTVTTAAGCTETRMIKHTVLPAPLATCKGAINLLLFDPTEKCNGKATVKLMDEKATEIKDVKYIWSDGRTGSTVENLCPDKPYSVQAVIEGVCQKNTSFTMLSKPVWKVTNANGQNKFSVISPKEEIQYEWDFGNGMFFKGAEVNYNFETDGVYNVTLKAVSGSDFTEYSQQVEVLKSVTSIGNIKNPELEVYPNPVKDILKINFGHPVDGTIEIEIMNIAGQLVFSQKMATDGFSQTAINVQQLKPGIYFLRVINDSFPFTGRKFVKAD
jgi:PKD repeat protein